MTRSDAEIRQAGPFYLLAGRGSGRGTPSPRLKHLWLSIKIEDSSGYLSDKHTEILRRGAPGNLGGSPGIQPPFSAGGGGILVSFVISIQGEGTYQIQCVRKSTLLFIHLRSDLIKVKIKSWRNPFHSLLKENDFRECLPLGLILIP